MRKNKFALYLTYGDRERRAFIETLDFADQGILPHNKNEILRRGLHCCRFLAEVDENLMLGQIIQYLTYLSEEDQLTRDRFNSALQFLTNFRFTSIAVMVAHNGIEAYDAYANVFDRLKRLEDALRDLLTDKSLPKIIKLPAEIRDELSRLEAAVDALFIKR